MGDGTLGRLEVPRQAMYLGERSGDGPPDFDGRLRICDVVRGPLVSDWLGEQRGYFWVTVAPAFRSSGGPELTEVVLVERSREYGFGLLDTSYVSVLVCNILDDLALAGGASRLSTILRVIHTGHLAKDAALLPPTDAESFANSMQILRSFVSRTGHTQIALDEREQGVRVGVFVANVRMAYQHGTLPRWQADELESIVQWYWYRDDEIALLTAYAVRFGNTNVPEDYVVDARALGRWVSSCRRDFHNGFLSSECGERLNTVPYWHW